MIRVLTLMLAVAASGQVIAATLYQWTDEAGVVHFTDNAANVPPQYRKQGKRDVKGVQASTGAGIGERIWREKCAKCHFMGEGLLEGRNGEDGKRGLRRFVFNSETGFPYTDETVRKDLVPYLDGSASRNMPAVKLSDEELASLINYMQRAVQ